MAFDLSWKILVSDVASDINITSYVFDGSVDMQAEVGEMGRSSATITINNNGGQFTPNGTGTYASIDWFAKALVIRASSINTFQDVVVFAGLITDFQIVNESIKQSEVVIQAVDFLTIAGRSTTQTPYASRTTPAGTMIEESINGDASYWPGTLTPFMNGVSKSRIAVGKYSSIEAPFSTFNTTVWSTQLQPNARIGDWINNQIMTALPGVCFMTTYAITAGVWTWGGAYLDKTLNRSTLIRIFEFVDSSSAITSGQIPYSSIDINYQLDTLTNATTTSNNSGAYTGSSSNETSNAKYGTRSRQYTSTANTNAIDVQYIADFWSNRYGDARYIPEQIVTSYSVLRGSAVDDTVALTSFIDLLDPRYAIWNRINARYKMVGMAAATTAQVIATQRKVMFTPSDTKIVLSTVSGPDNQSFILDSYLYGYGVLDKDRIA
jgi:hypothetical protein